MEQSKVGKKVARTVLGKVGKMELQMVGKKAP